MPEKKESDNKIELVKWFSEISKKDGKIVGGKGANLGEIFNQKVPVPEGFVVTAQAYRYFIEKANLDEKIKHILNSITYEDTSDLNKKTKQIRELIIKTEMPENLKEEIIESYEHLSANKIEIERGSAADILNTAHEPIFVAVRSSATTEDLAEASFAGQQDTYLNIKGKDQILESIKKCFASLFTSRATYYRNKKNFNYEQANLAVVVQRMVNSEKSGVVFSKDPTNKSEDIIIEAVWGLGEGIVSGRITPDTYILSEDLKIKSKNIEDKKIAIKRTSAGENKVFELREERSKHQVLEQHEIMKIADYAQKLEEHYQKPQDIEFAIENQDIYIVQTRPITTLKKGEKRDEEKIEGEEVLSGLAASPGIGVGKVKIIEDLEDLHKIQEGDVLVTKMTNPDMVVSMQKSSAIITDEGGLTAHASIVSREMGLPCVVGTRKATQILKEGQEVTVDGYNGKVYSGKVHEPEKKEIRPITTTTKTKLKLIVDLPSYAERASKTGIKKVGLTRMEGIIAESGIHPNYFIENGNFKEYEEIIYKGIKGISKYFEEMWIRTSDIRSDEFGNLKGAPQEKESNPMLGMHGIRYSLKNPKILKAELNALKKIKKESEKNLGILMPQIISVEEVKEVKNILKEIEFKDLKIGIMIETPAAVQQIKELCEEGIDFISFGTNDLTQYILAIDRGNQKVQSLYNEMHPAILHQLAYVIRVCKRNNVETSICGQAGSKKPMVKYLVENNIDSISLNADIAADMAEYIKNVEEEILKGTDKEPRQYELKKQEEEIQKTQQKINMEENDNKETIEEKEETKEIEKKAYIDQIPEEEKEKIEEDIKKIEDEKKEYLREHPEEESKKEEQEEENPSKENDEKDNLGIL